MPGQSGTFAAFSWLSAEILARVWLGTTHRVERPDAFETLGFRERYQALAGSVRHTSSNYPEGL